MSPDVSTAANPAKPARRSRAEMREQSIEQIVDAAEYLFAEHGFHGVTLKDVAQRVGVHTSLMHYYFADKRALFDAVFDRRAAVTRDRRMAALDAYEAACAGEPTVEGALHAYLDTDLDLYISGGEGWRNWGALGGQLSNSKFGAQLMDEHFDAVVLRLVDLLQRAMPGVPAQEIFWGYHFVTGSLLLTLSRTGRIDRLSGGLCRSEDFEAVKARMARFMAAGFRELQHGSKGVEAEGAA